MRECGLSDPGHVFDQQVASGQETSDTVLDLRTFADDDRANLVDQPGQVLRKTLVHHMTIAEFEGPKRTMSTAFYSHSDCRLHDMGAGHPECPQRLDAISDHLRSTGLDIALDFRDAPLATHDQLERAHTTGYVNQITDVLQLVRDEGRPRSLDPDTVACPATLQAALRAAGAAVAARHALDAHGLARVAIIDFDVHHGNGTEDIVAGDDRVLMCSFFQHPLYPYSGAVPKGTNMVNVPVAPYTRGQALRETIEAMWMPALDEFRPQMIFFSAGFDAHREDDLGQLGLVEADYEWITRRVMEVADRHSQGRIVSCLEGGYNLSALARSVAAHVRVLADMA